MQRFIMLTQIAHENVDTPQGLEKLEKNVMGHIRNHCPEVKWISSYALLGPYDYLDIFDAPDLETATRLSTLIRTYGHAQSEVWPATEWGQFKEMLHSLE